MPPGGFVTTYPNSFGTCVSEGGITYIEFTYQNQFAEEQSVTFQAFSDHTVGFSVFVDKATLGPIADPLILAPGATSDPILLAIQTAPTEATTYRIQASVGGVPMFETPVVSAEVCPIVVMTADVQRVGAITPATNDDSVDFLVTITSPVDYPHNLQLQVNGDPALLVSPVGATTTTPGATPLDGDPMAGFFWKSEHFLAGVPKQYQISLLASSIVQSEPGATGGFPITVVGSLEGQGSAFTTITHREPIQPAQPAAPGSNQRLLPALDALDTYSTAHTATTGNIVLRIFARNNAESAPGIAATWNGAPLTVAAEIQDGTTGGPVAFLAAIKGGDTGAHNLEITCATGSAGVAAVLIEDVTDLDTDWVGAIGSFVGMSNGVDIAVTPENAPSNFTQVCGWVDQLAFPITDLGSATSTEWKTAIGVAGGADLLTGGDFLNPADWTLTSPWNITDGFALHPDTGLGDIRQTTAASTYREYEATYSIDGVSGSNAYVYLGDGTFQAPYYGTPRTAAGNYVDRLVSFQESASFGLRAEADTDAAFASVALRLVGGICTDFVSTATVAAFEHHLTFQPYNFGALHKAAALAVEIKGLVV